VIGLDGVADWATVRIRAGRAIGTLPPYGSPEWLRLDDRDPRKVAAVVVAAECWRWDGKTLPERLAVELTAVREAAEAFDAEVWAVSAAAVRRMACTPTHAELERRRWGDGGRAAFATPRPGDFEGMAVTL